jgi:hypothetical protein
MMLGFVEHYLAALGAVIALVATAGMRRSAVAMKPLTIVGLEVAGTVPRARRMLHTWGESGIAAARANIAWDFLFIPGYTMVGAGLALATLPSVAHAFGASAAPFGLGVAAIAVPVIAAMADVGENVLMLVTLGTGAPNGGVVKATRTLAVLKFRLVAVVFAWDLFVGVPAWIAGPHALTG